MRKRDGKHLRTKGKKHRLISSYKIINKETPEYLQPLIPNSADSFLRGHYTRQSQNISEIRTRTNFYSEYFLPATVKLWNKLPRNTWSSSSINIC